MFLRELAYDLEAVWHDYFTELLDGDAEWGRETAQRLVRFIAIEILEVLLDGHWHPFADFDLAICRTDGRIAQLAMYELDPDELSGVSGQEMLVHAGLCGLHEKGRVDYRPPHDSIPEMFRLNNEVRARVGFGRDKTGEPSDVPFFGTGHSEHERTRVITL